MDFICDFARSLAVGSGQQLHHGRVYSSTAGACGNRVGFPAYLWQTRCDLGANRALKPVKHEVLFLVSR